MPNLSNKEIKEGFTYSSAPSPFVLLRDDQYLFDAQFKEFPVWLGSNARAMMGMTQFLETWSAEWTDELNNINKAYRELRKRTQGSLCGKLRFKPLEPPTPAHGLPLTPAAVLYQYISLSILDQFNDVHQAATTTIENEFAKPIENAGQLICNPYVDAANFEFGFELKTEALVQPFFAALFQAGILVKRIRMASWVYDRWPKLQNRVKDDDGNVATRLVLFQLNFSYRPEEMKLFWQRLNLAFANFQNESAFYDSPSIEFRLNDPGQFEFHQALMKAKSTGKLPRDFRAKKFLETQLAQSKSRRNQSLNIVLLDNKNYAQYRDQILAVQSSVYEPARRTPPEEFDMLFDSENPLAILLLDGSKIAAMVFAGRLGLFTNERGVLTDPFVDDPNVYYSMDLTVMSEFRGGMGHWMKQALVLLAIENGVSAIHGRNRDRLAAGMWAINLSLGSYELQHLVDDYPDDEQHRDCLYYRCPLQWSKVDWKRVRKFNLASMINGSDLKNITLFEKD